jgi:hypothetical protein
MHSSAWKVNSPKFAGCKRPYSPTTATGLWECLTT